MAGAKHTCNYSEQQGALNIPKIKVGHQCEAQTINGDMRRLGLTLSGALGLTNNWANGEYLFVGLPLTEKLKCRL